MRITNTTKKNQWKSNIVKLGRQFVDNLSLYEKDDDSVNFQQPLGYIGSFDESDIIKINYSVDSGLFKSDMGTLTVEISNNSTLVSEITKNRLLSYNLSLDNESGDSSSFPTCDYGFFVIKKIEKLEDKNTVLLTCYDEMVRTMIPYDKPLIAYVNTTDTTFIDGKTYYTLSFGKYVEYTGSRTGSPAQKGLFEYTSPSFPMRLEDYFYYLAQNLGMGWYYPEVSITNKDNYLQKDPYLDDDGNSLGYTYRDIFDDIAEACGCRIITKTSVRNNQRFCYYQLVKMFHNYTNTENYREEYFNENGVSVGEKYGPINSILISNTESTKNVFYPDTIPQSPVTVNIVNNRILEQNDVDDYKVEIYNNVNGIEYYVNDLQSKGIGLLEIGDIYRITIKGNTYKCILFNDNLIRTTGLKENIHTNNPKQNVNDIEYINNSDKTEITSNLAYIKVNENSQLIKNIINGSQALDSLNVTGDAVIDGNINAHYFRSYNSDDIRTAVMGNSTNGGWMRLVDNNNANKLDMASTYLTFYDNSWNSTFNVDGTTGNTTIGGKLYLGQNGMQDYHEAGFIHDQYGNWKHKRNNANDSWSIQDNSGTNKFSVFPQTGDVKLKSIVAQNDRPSTPNFDHQYPDDKASMRFDICSGAMDSSGVKPTGGDGYLLTFFWDNTGQYDSQLFIPNGTGQLQTRFKNNGTWSSWYNVYSSQTSYDYYSDGGVKKYGYIEVWKTGNLVQFSAPNDVPSLSYGETYWLNLPAKYRPVADIMFKSYNNTEYVYMLIKTNGNVYLYNYSHAYTSAYNFGVCGTYLSP